MVNSRDRRDLCRATRKKHLIGNIKGLSWNWSRRHRMSQISGKCNNRMSRNTGQNRRPGRRRVNLPILRHKNILAATFAHITLCIQGNTLGISIGHRLHFDQLCIHIICRHLGKRRHGIGCQAIPRRKPNRHAFLQSFWSQVLAPFPHRDHHLDRAWHWIDGQFAKSPKNHRSDITRLQFINANRLQNGRFQFIFRIGNFHAINFGRIVKPLHMISQPETGRSSFGMITPYPLKNTRTVMHHMRQHVNFGIVPTYKIPIKPDLV